MVPCTDGHDCGFLFVPSCLLHCHFGNIQDNYLHPLPNIVIAITDVWNFGVKFFFQEQEHCYFIFLSISKSISCQYQNDSAYSFFSFDVDFVNKH